VGRGVVVAPAAEVGLGDAGLRVAVADEDAPLATATALGVEPRFKAEYTNWPVPPIRIAITNPSPSMALRRRLPGPRLERTCKARPAGTAGLSTHAPVTGSTASTVGSRSLGFRPPRA
jgi:hypothetical protein